jgi:hypothetical protein
MAATTRASTATTSHIARRVKKKQRENYIFFIAVFVFLFYFELRSDFSFITFIIIGDECERGQAEEGRGREEEGFSIWQFIARWKKGIKNAT